MSKNKVYLVGAGIGNKDYLTIKAKKLLDKADIIIHDRLLNMDILREYDKEKLYSVGKRASYHELTQDKINELLVSEAKNGKVVVRLKGGDPYIFGRGGEEAEFLLENGLDFEIVPGVTSGVVAPMYAGIPVTHRDFSTSVSFITGHRKNNIDDDFKKYAKLDGTLVFYMGLQNLDKITKDLIDGGLDRYTLISIIIKGGSNEQKVITSTLINIKDDIKGFEDASPALIVIGKVNELREKLDFVSKKPLFNKRVILTRARKQASIVVERLEELGAVVKEMPQIELNPINGESLKKEIDNIDKYKFIIFTSVNSVHIFFNNLLEKYDARKLSNCKIVSIGKKTFEELNKYSIKADFTPNTYNGDELTNLLKGKIAKDDNVLLPHSNLSRKDMIANLSKICKLTNIEVYENNIVKDNKDDEEIKKADYIIFSSSSTVTNFIENYGLDYLNSETIKIISIGKITSKTLLDNGVRKFIESNEATFDSIIDTLLEETKNENEKNKK